MTVFKRFMSPLNISRHSYATQFGKLCTATFPLMALGKVFNQKFEIGATIVFFITFIAAISAMFTKKKICPRWVRNTISDVLSFYILLCLPTLIYLCSGYQEYDNSIFFTNNYHALLFEIAFIIFIIVADICKHRKNAKKLK